MPGRGPGLGKEQVPGGRGGRSRHPDLPSQSPGDPAVAAAREGRWRPLQGPDGPAPRRAAVPVSIQRRARPPVGRTTHLVVTLCKDRVPHPDYMPPVLLSVLFGSAGCSVLTAPVERAGELSSAPGPGKAAATEGARDRTSRSMFC